MNPITRIQDAVAERFPEAALVVTKPVHETGWWTLDIGWKGHWVVCWSTAHHFGLWRDDSDAVYSEGMDELYQDYQQTLDRILALLTMDYGDRQDRAKAMIRSFRANKDYRHDLNGRTYTGDDVAREIEHMTDLGQSLVAVMGFVIQAKISTPEFFK